jgi:hypothetical protein
MKIASRRQKMNVGTEWILDREFSGSNAHVHVMFTFLIFTLLLRSIIRLA